MVANNGVEGYNNRMKNVIGSVKVPFAAWVQKLTKEIQFQEFCHFAHQQGFAHTKKFKDKDPFARQTELIYGDQASWILNQLPNKKGKSKKSVG